MVGVFRQKIVQCLVLGKYAKGGPYVLETLILYFTSEHFLSKDSEIGIWILLGTVVQLAMHMGYHRDPKHFTGMSPLAGEMRRRVWATVIDLDLGISAQMGLPRLIKQWQADTEEPRNLLDSDFDKNTVELPHARPETEITPMLYRLAKIRMMSTLGLISDFTADTRPYTYAEVIKIDKRLNEAHASNPECLKWRSIAHCITDSPQLIMQKVFLSIIFCKAKIVLHRKYLTLPRTQSQYSYSRDACLDAALRILETQHMLEEETQPFCQLYQERWRVSSLVNHDFLLATSILCFYLQQSHGKVNNATESARLENIQNSLRRSYDIWLRSSSSSREAQKAAGALSVVLRNRNAADAASDIPRNPSVDLQPFPGHSDPATGFQGEGQPLLRSRSFFRVLQGRLKRLSIRLTSVSDYLSGFNPPCPLFDPTSLENWAFPINEPFGSYLGSLWSANLDSQMTDGKQT